MRNIKHAITILSVLFAVMLTACNRYGDLFEQTDKVVESLYMSMKAMVSSADKKPALSRKTTTIKLSLSADL